MDSWDDDVLYSPDPPERHYPADCPVGDPYAPDCISPATHAHPPTCPQCAPEPFGPRCSYGHPDRTLLGYCRAECNRMLTGLHVQRAAKVLAGDTVRVRYLDAAIVLWRGRLA